MRENKDIKNSEYGHFLQSVGNFVSVIVTVISVHCNQSSVSARYSAYDFSAKSSSCCVLLVNPFHAYDTFLYPHETRGFLTFSGGIAMEHSPKMSSKLADLNTYRLKNFNMYMKLEEKFHICIVTLLSDFISNL